MSKKQKYSDNYNNDDILYIKDKRSMTSMGSSLYSSNGSESKKSFHSKEPFQDFPQKGNDIIQYKDFIFDQDDPNQINRNYWYRGELMQLVPDPFRELAMNSEVVVEQKIELLEVISGCESANRYNVYLLDKDKTKKFLFKCKEESSWCCRNFVPSSSRPFRLRMLHIKNSNKKPNYNKPLTDFERPYQCSCCCICKPTMVAYFRDEVKELKNMKSKKKKQNQSENDKGKESQTRKAIGRVEESCGCKPELFVHGEKGTLRWKIIADYCQCGFCCRTFSFGKCYEVDLWIYDANADPKVNKPVGNIHKVFKGLSELITDSNAFILTFPKKATPIERMMLIGSAMLIDFRYFEEVSLCDCGNVI